MRERGERRIVADRLRQILIGRRTTGEALPAWRLAFTLMLVILLAPLVSSCLLTVGAEGDPGAASATTATPVSVAAPGGNWHDLAVISLDFDPPLKPGEALAIDSPPAILVVVDNRGNQTESPVLVRLRIFGDDETDIVVKDKHTITSLASGQAKVVKFDRLTGLPLRSEYTIRIEVEPVDGEVSLDNNVREITVQPIAGSRGSP